MNSSFLDSLNFTNRLQTKTIHIGKLAVGGSNPIRLQSMTSVNTLDTNAVVSQCIRMIEAGCELVRITAPGISEAKHLAVIKQQLRLRGYHQPMVADIHFNPEAAEVAARIVEKIRINPGNYTDRKTGKSEYTESEYNQSIERIRQRIAPLIKICKEYGTAMRIGSNHGSLSERIMSRYGDTPEGMVESAIEFIDICESMDYYNLVLSMKSSNSRVMVQATRMLVTRMADRGTLYPLHLGVTEAGEGEDGRIRSAAGIGALLAEGIGDTIRVSLTEEPECELPVAKQLQSIFNKKHDLSTPTHTSLLPSDSTQTLNPFRFSRNQSTAQFGMGGAGQVIVIGQTDADVLFSETPSPHFKTETEIQIPLTTFDKQSLEEPQALLTDAKQIIDRIAKGTTTGWPTWLILEYNSIQQWPAIKQSLLLMRQQRETPIAIRCSIDEPDSSTFSIKTAALLGSLLTDGLTDAIWLVNSLLESKEVSRIAYNILQATRLRFTRTEFISCPSCGRTKFNIQEAVKQIREKTGHLKGLTIGVMGCIVNGPGEMAGADYGVVGSGNGRITLFKGQQIAKQAIAEAEAADELIALIKENGDWINQPLNE